MSLLDRCLRPSTSDDMEIRISDWVFQVDLEATFLHTSNNSQDHCECAYCRNFYESVDVVYPEVRSFLSQFGVVVEGPSELMPFEPTVILACYRIHGTVLTWGEKTILIGSIPVSVETGEGNSFLLWVGELALPWLQPEPEEDVVSPANTPEFMERMREIWLLRHEKEYQFS